MKYVGATHTGVARFQDADGAAYNPDTVTAVVTDPSGAETTPTPVQLAVGRWATTFLLDQAGFWFLEVTGTGPGDEVVVLRETVCAARNLASITS